jgi:D-glycero-D-manno-heptose 1,7-bisphosphate phosphatase
MIEKAMAKHGIDPEQSWMVGDRLSDVQAGRKAGVRTVLLGTKAEKDSGDYWATNLLKASKIILCEEK